uniref:N-acetyllactosaminide beta-1,3-N-acetylglucosaminyltransferase n=1 Tax=Syphacia muris TaxID=451379 RepID=A0A0N5AYJ5_9BILA
MLPRDVTKKLSCHIVFQSDVGCEMDAVSQIRKAEKNSEYPVNVARNIARMFVRSKYVLIADYEYVFSRDFEQRMVKLAQTELALRPKTALVFRIFEADASVPTLPRTKKELEQMMKTGKAIEFHARYARNAHKIPGLAKWFERPEGNGSATIFAEVPYKRSDWEPQFVSLNTIPLHDENFPFSIRDNTVLRWEMCRMGYKYAVVDDLFMIHRGIKTSRDVLRTRAYQRNVRAKFNSALKSFNKRMDKDYADTKSSCPNFGA